MRAVAWKGVSSLGRRAGHIYSHNVPLAHDDPGGPGWPFIAMQSANGMSKQPSHVQQAMVSLVVALLSDGEEAILLVAVERAGLHAPIACAASAALKRGTLAELLAEAFEIITVCKVAIVYALLRVALLLRDLLASIARAARARGFWVDDDSVAAHARVFALVVITVVWHCAGRAQQAHFELAVAVKVAEDGVARAAVQPAARNAPKGIRSCSMASLYRRHAPRDAPLAGVELSERAAGGSEQLIILVLGATGDGEVAQTPRSVGFFDLRGGLQGARSGLELAASRQNARCRASVVDDRLRTPLRAARRKKRRLARCGGGARPDIWEDCTTTSHANKAHTARPAIDTSVRQECVQGLLGCKNGG
eukprot:scaffold2236_cov385-Prasinococcus_capsulatus_cf.AAC.5